MLSGTAPSLFRCQGALSNTSPHKITAKKEKSPSIQHEISEEKMIMVSVIMPAYNVEQYIEKSIRSVMEQTYRDLELIVVNDASTDGTWDKICELIDEYGDRIRGINLEKNVRQGGARNRAIREARGEYLVFVDSDDWIAHDMVECFVSAIESENADLAGTERYYTYYSEDKITESTTGSGLGLIRKALPNLEEYKQYFLSVGGIWRNIFRRDIIVNNDIWFPEGVSYEDNYFVNIYLAYVKQYVSVDKAFYYYRQNPSSTVHRKDLSQLSRISVEKLIYTSLKERGVFDELYDECEFLCVRRWYLTTVGIYYNRFGRDGIRYAKEMAAEFKRHFPEYRKNKYLSKLLSKSEKVKLGLFELSPELLYLVYLIKAKLRHKA